MTPIDSKNASASLARVTPYLVDAAAEINRGIDRNKKVLVEGTQGLGLSLYHSDAYASDKPPSTARRPFRWRSRLEIGVASSETTVGAPLNTTYWGLLKQPDKQKKSKSRIWTTQRPQNPSLALTLHCFGHSSHEGVYRVTAFSIPQCYGLTNA